MKAAALNALLWWSGLSVFGPKDSRRRKMLPWVAAFVVGSVPALLVSDFLTFLVSMSLLVMLMVLLFLPVRFGPLA